MADVERLLMLFRAYRAQDEGAFYRAAESLIAEELAANHHGVAGELRKALGDTAPSKVEPRRNGLTALPKDRRSGDTIVSIMERPRDTSHLVLGDAAKKQIDRIIEEHRQRLKLARSGYSPKSKVLFWGPPGCGKTLTAHHLAAEFGLPIGTVQLSALISSFLGDTATHIQRVFDLAKKTPMVLLLDEVDAIGKNRDDPNDVGELKRVVNSLLQAIDSFFSTESLVIAASNHQYMLDPALWRRFDDLLLFPEPGLNQRLTLLKRLLNGVNYSGSLESLAKKMSGLSFAAIERCVVESIKTIIMADRDDLRPQDVMDQIRRHKETFQAAKKKSGKSMNE